MDKNQGEDQTWGKLACMPLSFSNKTTHHVSTVVCFTVSLTPSARTGTLNVISEAGTAGSKQSISQQHDVAHMNTSPNTTFHRKQPS